MGSDLAKSAIFAIALVMGSCVAHAGDVVVFQGVPSADEILQTWGVSPPQRKTRGLEKPAKTRVIVYPSSPQPEPVAANPIAATSQSPVVTGKAGATAAFELTFGLNSADLTGQSRVYVDKVAEALTMKPDLRIIIVGHADATGTPEYNDELSLRRAQSVREYLIGNGGIEPSRLSVVGKGARLPLDTHNPYAEVNRRVEFATVDGRSFGVGR